jgi:hypothetical protein
VTTPDQADRALLQAALVASTLSPHEPALTAAAAISQRFETAGHDADSDLYTRALCDARYIERVRFVRETLAFITAARRFEAASRAAQPAAIAAKPDNVIRLDTRRAAG